MDVNNSKYSELTFHQLETINDNMRCFRIVNMTTRSVSLNKDELDLLLRLKGDSFNLSGFVREAIRRELSHCKGGALPGKPKGGVDGDL